MITKPLRRTARHTASRAALAIVTLAAIAQPVGRTLAQDSQPTDWPSAVKNANTHPRYQMRRAIAKKIAQSGAEAVPAVRSFAETNGTNAIDLLVVDALAQSRIDDEAVLALLQDWSTDRDFYWRSQALGGLALRAAGKPKLRGLFVAALDDPSHLFRVEGARGLIALGKPSDRGAARRLLADPDPRARVRVAAALAKVGDTSGYDELLAAYARRELAFVGDPWGARDWGLVVETLGDIAGQRFVLHGEDGAAELERLRAFAAQRMGRDAKLPETLPIESFAGGVEVRSCRNGDLFVRWTDSEIAFGLTADHRVAVDPAEFEAVRDALPALLGDGGVLGSVVCDYLRLAAGAVTGQLKAAPAELPDPVAGWLETLASTLENAGEPSAAKSIRGRLPQFVKGE